MHCENPVCARVCPADAIKQTPDGVTQSSLKPRCIGCSNCVMACPFGVPKYLADFDQMMKCDMCYDRTSVGKRPMCATVCPSQALAFTTLEEIRRTRQGVPINWEADHYVTRRELTKFLTLGSCLLAAANAAMAFVGLRPRHGEARKRLIGKASGLAAGGYQLFRYPTDEDPCILVREKNGELRAYSQVCTHLSCAVVYKPAEETLFCPCHHGTFILDDGRPIFGPPTRRLPRIQIEQRGDEIWAVGREV